MITYEVSMGFSVAGVLLLSESLRPVAIVESQSGWMWNAIVQPIGFITFLVSAFAETNRLPFDFCLSFIFLLLSFILFCPKLYSVTLSKT